MLIRSVSICFRAPLIRQSPLRLCYTVVSLCSQLHDGMADGDGGEGGEGSGDDGVLVDHPDDVELSHLYVRHCHASAFAHHHLMLVCGVLIGDSVWQYV